MLKRKKKKEKRKKLKEWKFYDFISPKLHLWLLLCCHIVINEQQGLHLAAKTDVQIYVYRDGFVKNDMHGEILIFMDSGETLYCQIAISNKFLTIAIWLNCRHLAKL